MRTSVPAASEPAADFAPAPSASVEPTDVPSPESSPPRRRQAPPDPAAEHALLAEARTVLGEQPRRALALTETHRRDHPHGLLTPEREMIAIDALLALGRERAARARAQRLIRRRPESPYAARLLERGLVDAP